MRFLDLKQGFLVFILYVLSCIEIKLKVLIILSKNQSQGMDSKFKFGEPAKKLQNNLKYWGIYNLNSVIISRFLRILPSQNWLQSLYDEIFNIDRFLE